MSRRARAIRPPVPTLEAFLRSKGWAPQFRSNRCRVRFWFCDTYGSVDEELAIELAYGHWSMAER